MFVALAYSSLLARSSTADAHRHAELRSDPHGDDRSARRTRRALS
jgi:hypothetical protein